MKMFSLVPRSLRKTFSQVFHFTCNLPVSKAIDENGEPCAIEGTVYSPGNPWVAMWNVPSLPREAKIYVAHLFKELHQSPYGDSFYDSDDISWTHKPDHSLRLANHWNFTTGYDSGVHCRTDRAVDNTNQWTLAEYHAEDGLYHVLRTWDAVGQFHEHTNRSGDRFDKMIVSGDERRSQITYDGLEQIARLSSDATRKEFEASEISEYRNYLSRNGLVHKPFFFNTLTGQIKSATDNTGAFDAGEQHRAPDRAQDDARPDRIMKSLANAESPSGPWHLPTIAASTTE